LARRQTSGLFHRVALTVFVLAILGVPVLAFGAFEGFYNHVMKNLLYFGGATPALTTRFFPPPTYELPNDAFFRRPNGARRAHPRPTARRLWRPRRAEARRCAVGDPKDFAGGRRHLLLYNTAHSSPSADDKRRIL
jgi:hypothetical protein